MRQIKRKERPLPGVLATIAAGFELTTNHMWLISLPVLLDVIFWLGPRLSIAPLVERSAALLQQEEALTGLTQQVVQLAPQVNLVTYLSVPLVGVPVLMGGLAPSRMPLTPAIFEVNSALLWLGLLAGLTLIGLLLTTIYYGLIAQILRRNRESWRQFPRFLAVSWLRLLGLAFIFFLCLLMIYLPLVPVAILVALVSSGLAITLLFTAFVFVAVYLSFSVHGILLHKYPLLQALLDSVRLVHRYMYPTIGLFLFIILVRTAMEWLWHWADDGSWLTLVSIIGHGFVSTALMAATFIFYRDRVALLDEDT